MYFITFFGWRVKFFSFCSLCGASKVSWSEGRDLQLGLVRNDSWLLSHHNDSVWILMPLHLSSLHGNNGLFHKDERGRKWFCNVSARDSPWKMRWGICEYEGLSAFRHRMAFCLLLEGAALHCLTMGNVKKRIPESVYNKVLIQTWFCVHLESKNIGSGLFLTCQLRHARI